MEQQSCQLPRLSPELIFMIVGYNDPPDILALSLTCSDLHHRCRSLLEQHQNAYKTYRITSDLSPETAVDLLKDTLTAEINRYHVRELEFWGSRLKWEDWRSWDPALSDNYQVAAEEEPSRSAWDAREIEEYIQKGFRLWDLTEEKIEELRMSLDRGSEAWLKLLLICLCPRLRSTRFVKRRGESYNILAWMAMIIGWSVEDGCHWPPGFESLRSISVGVSIGQLPHEAEEEEYYAGFEEFTKLFHIPNLKNIYFSGLSCQEFFWEEHIWNEELLPNGTSNVEILFLDGVEGGWDEFYDWLSGASIKLDTVVLRATDSHRGGLDDVSNLVDSLAETNDNLRRLVLYHPAAMHQLYRQAGIYNHESVKQITLAVRDFDYRFNYTVNDWTFREPDSPIAFPPNVEAVYIWGGLNGRSRSWRRYIEHFDLFLATLIESGVHKQLKVVYVEHVERTSTKSIISLNIIGWREFVFPKATAAGRKAGVHVCTIMNRDDGGYWKNFPARPDRFDIKTGPFAAERPEEWKLNLHTGQWGPDCNGCGECEECLAVYPSELWEENAARRSSSD